MKILGFIAVGLIVLTAADVLCARGPSMTLAVPTFNDGGDSIIPFKVSVGSESPVLVVSPDILKDRSLLIINPSQNFNLMLGTCANFNVIDSYWIVPRASGSETSYSHQPIWAMLPAGSSTETVRGKSERQ